METLKKYSLEEDGWTKQSLASDNKRPYAPEEDAVDLCGIYLAEIGNTPLLSAAEEIELAKQIEGGQEAQKRINKGGLVPEEEAELNTVIIRATQARTEMVEKNLRLVVAVAKKYLGRGLPLLDLIQHGNMGLIKAVERYDWRRGFRFSTYAYWWIKQAVGRGVLTDARTIRLPVHLYEQISGINNIATNLMKDLGREPVADEVAEALKAYPEILKGSTAKKLSIITNAFRQTVPLSQTINADDEEDALADVIADDGADTEILGEQALLKSILPERLKNYLTSREIQVLLTRWGIYDGTGEKTLEETGKEFGVSRERIRQIETGAIEKLKHSEDFRKDFLDYINSDQRQS